MVKIKRTDSSDQDFRFLVSLLDKELATRDGDEHDFYNQFNKIENIKNAIIAYVDEQPIGCGSFKNYRQDIVEIKRMFVLPEHRGKGIAGLILQHLEMWAAELNNSTCILETGKKQPEAIALYKKSGYDYPKLWPV